MGSHRRTITAAAATILASVSLYPIFTGTLWFWGGAGAVCVVAAAGTLTRLRRLPLIVCLAGQLAGLLLYLNVAYASAQSLLRVIPTPASLHFLLVLAGEGFDEAGRYAPPVPPLWGMVLLTAGGIGLTAVATDLIAVRLGSAALAGLPLLLLFTEPFTLSVSRGALGTTVAFCLGAAGYLAMLSSEGRDRIREWEQPNPGPDEIPDTRALTAAGRRVGAASVVLALCLPLFIPGLHVTRLFGGGQPGIGGNGGGGAAGGGVGFPSPDTQLSNELHASRNAPVLTYRSSDATPQYLQIYVLDNLTGAGWQLSSQTGSLVPAGSRLPAPPGATDNTWATRVTTTVAIGKSVAQDDLLALPVPYPATTVSAPGTLRASRTSLMVFDNGVRLAGLHYAVTSLDEAPPPQALNAAPSPPADITRHDLGFPASYEPLRALAESVVNEAEAKTAFQKAIALQDWLSGGTFTYTLNAPTVTNASELANFLTATRQGYCQQFSFAMAVLARLLGIPSRVAYGFTAGTSTGQGTWLVTKHDAHAWPELYFQGFGWLRFEPTPAGGAAGQGTATAPSYTLQPASAFPQSPSQSAPGAAPASSAGGRSRIPGSLGARLGFPLGGEGNGTVSAPAPDPLSPWAVFGLCVAGLLVLAAIAPACVRLAVRRRRWRRGRRGGDVALARAAWRELRDDLTDYGVGCRPSESPRAVAARAAASLDLADPGAAALRRIALAEERARYAGRPDSGAGLRRDSAVVRRTIAAAVPRRSRWQARLMPSSVLMPVLAGLGRASDIFGRLNPEWFGTTQAGRITTRAGRIRFGRAHSGQPEASGEHGTAGAPGQPELPVTASSRRS
jgi:transglutaminase-like putative cysteine protease